MNQPTFKQKLRYRFDNFMAKGGSSIFTIIIIAFLIGYLIIGLIRTVIIAGGAGTGDHHGGFFNQIYIAFLQMTAPGNMNQDINSSPMLKIATIMAGLFGIILFSALIGFITTSLRAKLDELRKGRSKVIEDDHTLILGWNDQRVVEILRELVLANESEDNPAVVILADKEKEEMDDFLALNLPDTDNTRIVTRSGSTSSQANLKTVSAARCRSAIILASASDEANKRDKAKSDAHSIKTILALTTTRGDDNELNIVAELFDKHHHDIIQHYSPHPIGVANANEILAKIIVQTSRSIGLSVVYGEILSFDGCEMYFCDGDWGDITFGDAQFHFPDGVPMGVATAGGELLINPPIDLKLIEGDEILILAEDDSTIEFLPDPVAVAIDRPLLPGRLEQTVENELIIGWNKKGHIIVEEYAEYVLQGSTIHIIVDNPTQATQDEIADLNARLDTIDITLIDEDPLQTETLMASEPSKRDNVIILNGGDDRIGNASESDAQTILILLLLRKIFEQHPDETVNTRLITEVMDSSNQNLISRAGVKDFIISNRFISMLIAQMSEEARIKDVYDILFKEDGSEIYLKPLSLYFEDIPKEMTFADCIHMAQKREEVCLGVKIKADERNADSNFGVKLIPEKSTKYSFTAQDCLVVLSEDET